MCVFGEMTCHFISLLLFGAGVVVNELSVIGYLSFSLTIVYESNKKPSQIHFKFFIQKFEKNG